MGEFLLACSVPGIFLLSFPLALFLTRKAGNTTASKVIFSSVLVAGVVLMLMAMLYLPNVLGIEMTQERMISSTKSSISGAKFLGCVVGTAIWYPIMTYLMKCIEDQKE